MARDLISSNIEQGSLQPRRRFSRAWIPFLVISVVFAAAGHWVVRLKREALTGQVSTHLHLILNGSIALLESQFQVMESHLEDAVRQLRENPPSFDSSDPQAFLQVASDRLLWDLRTFSPVGVSLQGHTSAWSQPASIAVIGARVRYEGRSQSLSSGSVMRFGLPLLVPELADRLGENAIVLAWSVDIADSPISGLRKITVFFDARELLALVLQPGRHGTTGELYAFDRQGTMISDSRFDKHLYAIGLLAEGQRAPSRIRVADPGRNLIAQSTQASLRAHQSDPLTRMAQSATSGKDGFSLEAYRDYRGVPVIGAWKWLPAYGFGVTHEMDAEEAFQNIATLNMAFYALLGLLSIAALAMATLVTRSKRLTVMTMEAKDRAQELERQLNHMNRVATMGQLATGLAHELNQPLTTITNLARTLVISTQECGMLAGKEAVEQLQKIEKSAAMSGSIIHRLRNFLQSSSRDYESVWIRQLIDDSVRLMADLIRKDNIKIEIRLSDLDQSVMGDAIQIQQVLVNLLKNAIESLEAIDSKQRRIAIRTQVNVDDALELYIHDNGPGIDPAIAPQLFQEFVTSKADGMGLGLSISRAIMERHGGSIRWINDSQPGSCFVLTFPLNGLQQDAEFSANWASHAVAPGVPSAC